MRALLRIMGALCIAFALIGVAKEFDDARTHQSKDAGVGLALIVIFGGAGALLWRAASTVGRAAAEPHSTTIIRAAQKRGGRITAAEVAADTALTFELAKVELDKLAKAGGCEIVVGDAGIMVYRFPEFESPANKQDSV